MYEPHHHRHGHNCAQPTGHLRLTQPTVSTTLLTADRQASRTLPIDRLVG